MIWTLRGFYDSVAVVPLAAAAGRLRDKRWLEGCACFGVALFFHYRALFYVPWIFVCGWRIVQERGWMQWRAREWCLAGATALLVGISLSTFVLVSPSIASVPLENPIRPGHLKLLPVLASASAFAGALVVLARQRQWLDVSTLFWISLMLVSVRQVQAWHAILFAPWLFARAASESVRAARLVFLSTITLAVFL
jgi:hypothetical protein